MRVPHEEWQFGIVPGHDPPGRGSIRVGDATMMVAPEARAVSMVVIAVWTVEAVSLTASILLTRSTPMGGKKKSRTGTTSATPPANAPARASTRPPNAHRGGTRGSMCPGSAE
jgi:hypothetical protein